MGKLVLPGFIDNHSHLGEGGEVTCLPQDDLDIEQQAARLAKCASGVAKGKWIIGYGMTLDNVLGFDDLSYVQWKKLSHFFLEKIIINNTDDVLEIGCGAGAFTKQIKSYKSISGVDYSIDAINTIKNQIPDGKFYHAEASALPFQDNAFDRIICFSVFFYFASYEYANQTLQEMLRVLKPGGKILIGEVSDIHKKDIAMKLRAKSQSVRKGREVYDAEVQHLYYPADFFEQFAVENNMNSQLIDENVPELSFYESSAYRFSVLLEDNERSV